VSRQPVSDLLPRTWNKQTKQKLDAIEYYRKDKSKFGLGRGR